MPATSRDGSLLDALAAAASPLKGTARSSGAFLLNSHLLTSTTNTTITTAAHNTATALQTGLAILGFLLALHRGVSWVRTSRAQQASASSYTRQRRQQIFTDDKMQREISHHHRRRRASEPTLSTIPERCRQQRHRHQQRRRLQKILLPKLPPAPPLTPPELSDSVFHCDEQVDGFINQPNPDYMSATSCLPVEPSLPTHKRRSYVKMLPIGGVSAAVKFPTPTLSPVTSESEAAIAAAVDGSSISSDVATPSANSKSHISETEISHSPRVWQASQNRQESQQQRRQEDLETKSQDSTDSLTRRSIEVKGEIISVVNPDGAGWSRHTRVYGGGVCLACAALSGHHDGFLGATNARFDYYTPND